MRNREKEREGEGGREGGREIVRDTETQTEKEIVLSSVFCKQIKMKTTIRVYDEYISFS